MTTEQQARDALDAMDDYARMANIAAVGPLKVLSDFITQAAEDKRIADAVRRHGVRTYAGRVYDCNLGRDGALIEETLPESMIGNVLIIPADAVESK